MSDMRPYDVKPKGKPQAPAAFEPCAWAVCAAVALAFALLTDLTPHRVWGLLAAVGYAAAALVAIRGRPVRARAVAAVGAVALPLIALLALGLRQLEVTVVERSAELLFTTGSPYVADPSAVADFNPYLPGMALFGALPGDARWWMGGAFVAALAGAGLGARRGAGLLACPLVALPLAVGGIDLPVVGLLCLALALAGRGRAGPGRVREVRPAPRRLARTLAAPGEAPSTSSTSGITRHAESTHQLHPSAAPPRAQGPPSGRTTGLRGHDLAGLAVGAAAALKWTAWPAFPVVLALIAVRQGKAAALRYAAVATGTATAAVLPFALTNPAGFYENVVAFPLGLTGVRSPAASPLPGHLLAEHVPGGGVIALVLLAVSALLLAVSLVLRPPPTTRAAAHRLALGLGLAMALMPATRFGYLVCPLVLWAAVRPAAGPEQPLVPRNFRKKALA